jgi:hypothetical protein
MTAVNKSPWIKNLLGIVSPQIFPGKVQAGSSATIKRGEICTYDETSGYFIAANAVADRRYSLAIANEEQKSDGLARYMEFIALRPDDVFEFALDAAAQIELGDGLELTASDSQKLTRDVDGDCVAFSVEIDNYPESGTTLLSRSYCQVVFNPVYSYWCQRVLKDGLYKTIETAASLTLKVEDLGAVVEVSDTATITLPESNVPKGWHVKIVVEAAVVCTIDPKPDTAGIIIAGSGPHTAGHAISMTDEGDFVELMWNGTNWVAINGIHGADGDITLV